MPLFMIRKNILEGTGKNSRYIVIKNEILIGSTALKVLLKAALSI